MTRRDVTKVVPRAAAAVTLLVVALLFPQVAAAQSSTTFCITNYTTAPSSNVYALGISPSDAELVITSVAKSISLNIADVKIIPCDQAEKAYSYVPETGDSQVPHGEYILYDPQWLKEVIGNDKTEAMAIFGHELGHLLNRDFYPPRTAVARIQLETDADRFAGCAVAKLDGDYSRMIELLSRIRPAVDADYPSVEHSIASATAGFHDCGGAEQKKTAPTLPIGDSGWVDGGSSPGAFCTPILVQYQQQYPDFDIAMQLLPEESHKDILGHVTYHYRCSFSAKEKAPTLGLKGGLGWIFAGYYQDGDFLANSQYALSLSGNSPSQIDTTQGCHSNPGKKDYFRKGDQIIVMGNRRMVFLVGGYDPKQPTNWEKCPLSMPDASSASSNYTGVTVPIGATAQIVDVAIGHSKGAPYAIWLLVRDPN